MLRRRRLPWKTGPGAAARVSFPPARTPVHKEMMSPTQRSLAHLKHLGYAAKVVEKWNPFAKIRQDLFGADVLALKAGEPVLAIQATTGANHAARRTKLEAEGFVALWKGAGAALEIWSWTHARPRGKRKVWTLRREGM